MGSSTIHRLCVFCGSHHGRRPVYRETAVALGRALAERGITLVYGGGSVGLMGDVADATLQSGGHVVGVIPERLATSEFMHEGLTELHVVDSMHERKAMMSELADGFVALPGGFGTLEETLEVITWGQLRLQSKPIGLLDVEGYFADLVALVDHGVAEGFIDTRHRHIFVTETRVEALLDCLETYEPESPPLGPLGMEGR